MSGFNLSTVLVLWGRLHLQEPSSFPQCCLLSVRITWTPAAREREREIRGWSHVESMHAVTSKVTVNGELDSPTLELDPLIDPLIFVQVT